ncbi:hypothetical protein MIND_00531800 [Mycena indigotica]|uniref:Uncharacterized protein n=1 Tax=Mycena indigotica TaxID=2126181 RepID=A0A8H6SZW8_9AGAR|nr:uncharacterized protein MIND_00531800 [Mycena indigotica]KAF7307377.1 hypothetical protein MIND_00531800 [Mycena indigotica]
MNPAATGVITSTDTSQLNSMASVEKTPEAAFAPLGGTFAVLTIDPVASVEYLHDPEATTASAKLVSKDYVVSIPALQCMFNPAAPFREEDVLFVQQGRPQDFPAQCIDASMSIPIVPQNCGVDEHPSKREPVRMATNPFPFADCYLSAFATANVRTANILVVDPIICVLHKEDQLRVSNLTEDDFELRRLKRLREQKGKEEQRQNVIPPARRMTEAM